MRAREGKSSLMRARLAGPLIFYRDQYYSRFNHIALRFLVLDLFYGWKKHNSKRWMQYGKQNVKNLCTLVLVCEICVQQSQKNHELKQNWATMIQLPF